jgi:glutathione S-transferase
MAEATGSDTTLLISSKNYSSWSLRGFLLARLSGLPFREQVVAADDPATRAELLLQSSSILVPCLVHEGVRVWDTMAIAEYLHEIRPKVGMYPLDRPARARCRSISGEMHSGFSALRSSLPMNLRGRRPGFTVWSGARADIARILAIWEECLDTWGGPYLFGGRLTVADAMYAPVVTRFVTYDVTLEGAAADYAARIQDWPDLREWTAAAEAEPEQIEDLEVEF